MPRATAVAPAPELPASPVRLRHVLLLGAVGLAGTWLYPRAQAAWRLNGLAAALADYGSCMAGPTGAPLLRSRQLDEENAMAILDGGLAAQLEARFSADLARSSAIDLGDWRRRSPLLRLVQLSARLIENQS